MSATLRTYVDGYEVVISGMADTDSTDDVFTGWYVADWDQQEVEISGSVIDWVRADGSVVGGVWADGQVAV